MLIIIHHYSFKVFLIYLFVLLSSGEASSGMLCPALAPPVQERSRHNTKSPTEGYKRIGALLL